MPRSDFASRYVFLPLIRSISYGALLVISIKSRTLSTESSKTFTPMINSFSFSPSIWVSLYTPFPVTASPLSPLLLSLIFVLCASLYFFFSLLLHIRLYSHRIFVQYCYIVNFFQFSIYFPSPFLHLFACLCFSFLISFCPFGPSHAKSTVLHHPISIFSALQSPHHTQCQSMFFSSGPWQMCHPTRTRPPYIWEPGGNEDDVLCLHTRHN